MWSNEESVLAIECCYQIFLIVDADADVVGRPVVEEAVGVETHDDGLRAELDKDALATDADVVPPVSEV